MKPPAQRPSRGAPPVLVFADDFDDGPDEAPEPAAAEPAEPPPVEPLFTRAEMDGARADGFREGRARAAAETAQAKRLSALEDLAQTLRATRDEVAAGSDRAAEELANLLLAALAAMLPGLCRAHGEAEARAVLRLVLPGLSREPRAVVRASERTLAALELELQPLDREARAMLVLASSGTMVDGDVRITWNHGSAERSAAAIWRDVAAALALAGLAPPGLAPPGLAPPGLAPPGLTPAAALKETVDA
jgi:hypothetical protein